MLRWIQHLEGGKKEDGCPKGERNDAAIVAGNKVYFFEGYNAKNEENMKSQQIMVHVFNTVSSCWATLPPVSPGREDHHAVPPRRWGHTAVLIEDTAFIWGGHWRGTYYPELHAFDVDAHRWSKPRVSGTSPEGRRNHSACVLGKVMYVHGGWTQLTIFTNDIYKLDTSTMVWSLINARGPPPQASLDGVYMNRGHSATIIGTKMVVFVSYGGYGLNYSSISVFDTETNCWLDIYYLRAPPQGRCCHSAFTYNGELYVFGGYDDNLTTLGDLWRFSPVHWDWRKVQPKRKGPGPTHGMCCCTMGDRVILFGGYKEVLTYTENSCMGVDTHAGDLFILDLSPSLKTLCKLWVVLYGLFILDLSPSLKTLCKLWVVQYGLDRSELPHDIRWELATMTT